MTWEQIQMHAGLVKLDLDVAEAEMLDLETRAVVAEARAEAAWDRLMEMVR